MSSVNIVIAQKNSTTAQELARALAVHFSSVSVATSAQELEVILRRRQPRVAVVDMELIPLDQLPKLTKVLPGVSIVCTHRVPDEWMWMAALRAGATEFCHPRDLGVILHVAQRTSAMNPHSPIAA
jgi:DNA-binding NtrC family response regulator